MVGMELGIDIVWEVIEKDCCDGSNCMIGKGKTPLRCSRYWFSGKGSSGTKNRDVGRDEGVGSHWGSKVLPSRSGDIDIVGIDGDIVVEQGEKEGVE